MTSSESAGDSARGELLRDVRVVERGTAGAACFSARSVAVTIAWAGADRRRRRRHSNLGRRRRRRLLKRVLGLLMELGRRLLLGRRRVLLMLIIRMRVVLLLLLLLLLLIAVRGGRIGLRLLMLSLMRIR
jgi:hypothetical protein